METLAEVVRKTVSWYAAAGINARSYLLVSPDEKIYSVEVVDLSPKRRAPGIAVLARIEGDYVIIEADTTDKPLVDRLVDAGIPRDRIVEYYAGEALPKELKQPADLPLP